MKFFGGNSDIYSIRGEGDKTLLPRDTKFTIFVSHFSDHCISIIHFNKVQLLKARFNGSRIHGKEATSRDHLLVLH